MKLSQELAWRGMTNQSTLDTDQIDQGPRKFYWGVDPSADSMTIGNLSAAMMAKVFIKNGWQAVLLIGGATGLIGDPDGKAQERDLKTLETIAQNKAGIASEYKQVFGGADFDIVDNYNWFKDIDFIGFLREVGKHVPLSMMLDRAFINDRLGEGGAGISYAEFSYSLIQGYDFVHLSREMGVQVQLCGADQWGNSIAGVDLIRRMDSKEAHVISCPLVVNKSTGVKFGKSEGGAVWLNPEKTSIYKFYQFWLNVDDEGASDYIKIYTEIMPGEYDQLMQEFESDKSSRKAQKYLAYECTKIVHGQQAADAARQATEILFGGKGTSELSKDVIEVLSQELPVVKAGQSVVDALIESAVVKSKGEARRLIQQNAISFAGKKVTNPELQLDQTGLLKKGKNTFILVGNGSGGR